MQHKRLYDNSIKEEDQKLHVRNSLKIYLYIIISLSVQIAKNN